MTSTNKKRACPATSKPTCTNGAKCSTCTCAAQVRRIDYFAGIALAGILASRPDEAMSLCDDGEDLALACAHAARAMEQAAIAAGGGR